MRSHRLALRRAAVATPLTIALAICAAQPAAARSRHHRHEVMQGREVYAPAPRTRDPREFYPNDIEGGVPGNLPFNNQIRKMTDPLNANGAGR